MKLVSGATFDLLNEPTGTEPLLLVQVNFGAGLSYYCERELSTQNGDLVNCSGKILSVGSFIYQKKTDSCGASGSTNITLDDADGALKFAYENTIMEQKPVAIYIYYPSTGFNDLLMLAKGKITGPIKWSEGQRTISFQIETQVQSIELGYAPTEVDVPNLNSDNYQVTWPMMFGNCSHVPAVQIKKKTRGFLKADIKLQSEVFKITQNDSTKIVEFADKCTVSSYIRDESDNISESKNIIYIEGGDKFPSGTIKLIIQNIVFSGSFKDNSDKSKFTVLTANEPKYPNITVDSRKTVETNEDEYSILWIKDEKQQIAGMYVYSNTTHEDNYCVKQVGTKCYFSRPFVDSKGTKIKPVSGTFSAFGTYRNGLHRDRNAQDISQYVKMIGLFTGADKTRALTNWATDQLKKISKTGNAFTEFSTNEEVRLWSDDDPDYYIASSAELESVDGVYTKRTLKFADGKTRQMFVPVPKSWYTVELQSPYKVPGKLGSAHNSTGIKFDTSLESHDSEGSSWNGDIYVTGTSKIGPNISDIIKWILQNYTDVQVDTFSFNAVKTQVNSTPANFTLNTLEDALKVCEDLAWQSRCVLILDSDIAYLRYLPVEPNPIMLLTNNRVQLKSIEEGFTPLSEVKTELTGIWSDSFRDLPVPTRTKTQEFEQILKRIIPEFNKKADTNKAYVYKNNVSIFGRIQEQKDLRIYNEEDFVGQTIDFWGGRHSNVWKTLSLKAFIECSVLQPFDCIQLDLTGKTIYNTLAIVESVNYDHNSKDVELMLWIPVTAGKQSESPDAWPES